MSGRTLAIGDIHGCRDQLELLLDHIVPTADDTLIFLGDLIDRGPDSAGVIRQIMRLASKTNVKVIQGNHEELMLAARTSHNTFASWLLNGGNATLSSYAGARAKVRDIPADHWNFLENGLVNFVETATHIFVHAGLEPGLALAEQPTYALRWRRFDNIQPHISGKTIICGHSPQTNSQPKNIGFAICLDTHAYATGCLTCLDVGTNSIWQTTAGNRVVRSQLPAPEST